MRGEAVMKYSASVSVPSINKTLEDTWISIEKEGLALEGLLVDYADIKQIRPINHRVWIDLFDESSIEISMLGFSFDGFFEKLMECFGNRSMEALFVEETVIMTCEGEYELPPDKAGIKESGRCRIHLYPDSVCILPQTSHAVRIPLCFTKEIRLDGYLLSLTMQTGERYIVGKMGYDTKPFAERCSQCATRTIQERHLIKQTLNAISPFDHPGLFRTNQPEEHWAAAFGNKRCAVELYTGENAATYLYTFNDLDQFCFCLEEAMEAVGSHRELIFLSEEQLNEKPLYRMAVHRSQAVRFLRSCSIGRLIHNNQHEKKLSEFLS